LVARVLLSRRRHLGLGSLCPPEYTHSKLAASLGGLVSTALLAVTAARPLA
jgi:hypothetical protein